MITYTELIIGRDGKASQIVSRVKEGGGVASLRSCSSCGTPGAALGGGHGHGRRARNVNTSGSLNSCGRRVEPTRSSSRL